MEVTPDIAEFIGIIMGDRCLTRYISKRRTDYRIYISGGHEEIEFFNFIKIKLDKLFLHKCHILVKKDGLLLILDNKKALEFFEKSGVPVGKKPKTMKIPSLILKDKKLSYSFLRGLADTDFSVCFRKGGKKVGNKHSYPRITASSISGNLLEDVTKILDSLNISYFFYNRDKKTNFGEFREYIIDINGRRNFQLWMEHIGFSNKKHLSKIEVWKKLGYCPPHTTYEERLKLLEQ